MSNSTSGPQTHAEAVKAAETSKANVAPGGSTNTTNWNWSAKETFFANGGK